MAAVVTALAAEVGTAESDSESESEAEALPVAVAVAAMEEEAAMEEAEAEADAMAVAKETSVVMEAAAEKAVKEAEETAKEMEAAAREEASAAVVCEVGNQEGHSNGHSPVQRGNSPPSASPPSLLLPAAAAHPADVAQTVVALPLPLLLLLLRQPLGVLPPVHLLSALGRALRRHMLVAIRMAAARSAALRHVACWECFAPFLNAHREVIRFGKTSTRNVTFSSQTGVGLGPYKHQK